MATKRAHIPRDEFAKAAAAAAAAGVVTVAGKVARDKVVRGRQRPRGYKLKDAEPVPEGVERIALGRIDDALDELRGKTDSSREEAIHEARKNVKKLRALLRMVRGEIGDKAYRRENDAFREIGRGLSGVRDADVMIETLDALVERNPKGVPPEVAQGLMQALYAHRRGLEQDGAAAGSPKAIDGLRAARERVEDWPIAHDSFDALEPGLKRTYKRGRDAYRAALADPNTESLHAWRRRVKDHWHHHTILERAWPGVMERFGDEAHALSNLLGDDHDLAVLREWAWEHPQDAGNVPGLEALAEAVGRRRAQLQREALELGARLYAERPSDFAQRLRLYWEAWRERPTPEQAALG